MIQRYTYIFTENLLIPIILIMLDTWRFYVCSIEWVLILKNENM